MDRTAKKSLSKVYTSSGPSTPTLGREDSIAIIDN